MIDIQAGDVVVCVDNEPREWNFRHHLEYLSRLKINRLYRVTGLGKRATIFLLNEPAADERAGYGWAPGRFRKLDKATDEFTTQIKAIRPIREDA